MSRIDYGRAVQARLAEIAEVRGGYIAPARKPAASATANGLQVGDVGLDGRIDWPAIRAVSAPRDSGRYQVHEGDVLLPLRSTRLVAAVARDVPKGIIAVGSWAMLTPHEGRVIPDFLAWYLNHPTTARRLAQLSQGSSLQFLSLSAVRDLEVEVPKLEMQTRIARANHLELRVTAMEQRLADARRRLVDAVTIEALRGEGDRPRPQRPIREGDLDDE